MLTLYIPNLMTLVSIFNIIIIIIMLIISIDKWKSEEARKEFFENYALTKGFDPLMACNWYMQPKTRFWSTQVSWFYWLIIIIYYLFCNFNCFTIREFLEWYHTIIIAYPKHWLIYFLLVVLNTHLFGQKVDHFIISLAYNFLNYFHSCMDR